MIYIVTFYNPSFKRKMQLPIEINTEFDEAKDQVRVLVPKQDYVIDELMTYAEPVFKIE